MYQSVNRLYRIIIQSAIILASLLVIQPLSTAEQTALQLALKPIPGVTDGTQEPAPAKKPPKSTPAAKKKTPKKKRATAKLTVQAQPSGARVQVMNIVPKYRAGMALAPGSYDIRVSRSGYQTYRRWHRLKAGSRVIKVTLKRLASKPVSKPKPPAVLQDNLPNGVKGPKMVLIRGGRYQMGSPVSEIGRNENEQQHWVTVGDFYIGQYEVTFAEYDQFAQATDREKPNDEGWGRGNRPVINVSWRDAVAYAHWLSGQTGQKYRLPTEAEWEYAARAGARTAYWWGTRIDWNKANCNGCGSRWDVQQTAPVGSLTANVYGLFDTAGNVWEQTCSEYDENYSGAENKCIGNNNAQFRALRGGSWDSKPHWLRSASRDWTTPDGRDNSLGFRLTRSL